MTGTINHNEVNFRIQARAVDELLNGSTKCTSAGTPISGNTSSSGHGYRY